MAITRAQQAKQLLAQGGRTGFFLGGGGGADYEIGGGGNPNINRRVDPRDVGFDPREAQKSKQYSGITPTDDKGRIIDKEAKPNIIDKTKNILDRFNRKTIDKNTQFFRRNLNKKRKEYLDKFNLTEEQLDALLEGGAGDLTFENFQQLLDLDPSARNLGEDFNEALMKGELGELEMSPGMKKGNKLTKGLLYATPDSTTRIELPNFAFSKLQGPENFTNFVSGLNRMEVLQKLIDQPGGVTSKDIENYRNLTQGKGGIDPITGETIDALFYPRDEGSPEYMDPCKGPNPPAYCFTGIRSVEPETTEQQLLTSRILGTQFAADGGRIGLAKGSYSRSYNPGAGGVVQHSPVSTNIGGGGDGPKGPPSVINPPKTNPIVERLKKRNPPGDSPFKKFLAHDKFVDQLKARRGKNYHELGGLDFMARFPNMNPEVAKMLASGYQNVFELGRAIKDGLGGKTIADALDTAKEEARLNAVGIDAFFDPTSSLYQKYAGMVPESGAVQMAGGGIASLDREAFLLGGIAKGLKKAVRGVKKIAKSPIGKMALTAAAIKLGGGLGGLKGKLFGLPGVDEFGGTMGLFGKLGLTEGFGGMMPTLKGGITLASILPLLVGKTDEEKDDILKDYYASQKLEPATTARQAGSEFDFYNYNLAEGGTPRKEPVAKKVMPLLDMGGMEKDYRAEGGFVPIGRMEKADDVPARLSKNEFVFTAEAVRNAGDGDVDKGAEVMYNMMKNLESGGDVSEESQGLKGAREMFQTSQRLGEVI